MLDSRYYERDMHYAITKQLTAFNFEQPKKESEGTKRALRKGFRSEGDVKLMVLKIKCID